jgi:FkbM family methyltransferase
MQLEEFYGHTIHTRFLDARSVVIDLGANRGEFARQIIRRFGCRCLSVEANPALSAVAQTHGNHSWFNFAVASREGTLPFHVRRNSESSSLTAEGDGDVLGVVEVRTRRLDEFLTEQGIGEVSLLKCDIEGAEVDVFESASDDLLRRINQITIEFHDFNQTTPAATVRRIVARLEMLGFFALRMSAHGHSDTLFINRARCGISLAECLWLRYAVRNWRGMQRIVQRHMPKPAEPQSVGGVTGSRPPAM